MSEVYRKSGWSVRWENGVVVRVVESGVAIEDEGFRCAPEGKAADALPHSETVVDISHRIREIVKAHRIERLIVAEGEAQHDCDGRTWSERSERIHLAIIKNIRVLVDQASFDLHEIETIARALDRLTDGPAPQRLRLAPNVGAALASLIGTSQRPGGIDGKGFPIVAPPGANWYRPSYRVRPVRMPMHLELRAGSDQTEDAPRAIALLAPPHGGALEVLVDDGEKAWPAVIRARLPRAVGPDVSFYPYGAGSFGAEMMF